MQAPDPAADLALLLDAARAAEGIARAHWRADPQTWTKADDSPVTEADLKVDRHLRDMLGTARPGYGWLSEESEDDPARLEAQTVFIVDPIDGTRSYAAGQTDWAHSLAVAHRGRVVAAVVHLPLRDQTFAATADTATTLNGAPVAVTDAPACEGARLLAPRWALDPAGWRGGVAPGFDRSLRPALAWRLSLVAEGRFDAALTLRPVWEWDIAAGTLLVERAGGIVTDRRGARHAFNSAGRRSDGMIAAGPALHADILSHLA